MTVVEEQIQTAPALANPPGVKRPAAVFGTALGIEVEGADLYAVIVSARPAGATVVAKHKIADFRSRPPKEWGTEFHHWLREQGAKHLSAVVALPRREAIVRLVAMPGVKKKDLGPAIGYQIDSLHPYGEEEVRFGWMPVSGGSVVVGIMRQSTIDRYAALFQEAGVPVAGFTFPASAIYAALRLYGAPPKEVLAWREDDRGAVEVYGESSSKPVFSAEFEMAPARAVPLARAELRITSGDAKPLASILPEPKNVAAVPPLAYAVALAAIGNWRTPYANLLPPESRIVHSRARWIPTLALGLALLCVAIALGVYQQLREQKYLDTLASEISKVQPRAVRAEAIDKRAEQHRQRTKLIDDYKKRTQNDIDVLAELSRLLPPPVWLQSIEITRDTVTISGEADQAAPLLKLLDSSPIFHNSEFQMGLLKSKEGETFRIRTQRRPRK